LKEKELTLRRAKKKKKRKVEKDDTNQERIARWDRSRGEREESPPTTQKSDNNI